MRYTVSGYDAYGRPISEEISIVPLSVIPWWKSLLRDILPCNMAYRFGLTKIRRIFRIVFMENKG